MPDAEELASIYLEQSPCCCWIWSPDGTFEAIFNDPQAVLGVAADTLRGRRLSEALDETNAMRWQERLARTFAGESFTVRERLGETTWNISMFPMRMAGEIRYAGCQTREAPPWSIDQQQLRQTVVLMRKAQQQERDRMSRFLHDSIGQNMTAFGLQLDLLRMDLAKIAPEACSRIEALQNALEPAMAQVREYTYTLSPSHVERVGLRSALETLAARVHSNFAGIVHIQMESSVRVDTKTAAAVFRIAEEAVENAIKHARCSMIDIAVRTIRNGTILEVRDNGTGFNPEDPGEGCRGLGLPGMEHYAAEAGMAFSVESSVGAGTTVRAEARSNSEA